MATAALKALRRAFPRAEISFAVGSWSRPVLTEHPDIDQLVDVGPQALPTRSVPGFLGFLRQLRAGHYDLAVSLVRSATMSLALRWSGIPIRAGMHSGHRGFGYQYRAHVDPRVARHESDIYLDVVAALGIDTAGCLPQIPLPEAAADSLETKLQQRGIAPPFFVLHPGGGENPGAVFPNKRWPLENFLQLAARLEQRWSAQAIWLVGAEETSLITELRQRVPNLNYVFIGDLLFAEIAQLAHRAILYIGNDSGLSHYVAASQARVATIFGPSDPRRYAPLGPAALTLHRSQTSADASTLPHKPRTWNWQRAGIGVAEAETAILDWVSRQT